jgi:hypothetical protein
MNVPSSKLKSHQIISFGNHIQSQITNPAQTIQELLFNCEMNDIDFILSRYGLFHLIWLNSTQSIQNALAVNINNQGSFMYNLIVTAPKRLFLILRAFTNTELLHHLLTLSNAVNIAATANCTASLIHLLSFGAKINQDTINYVCKNNSETAMKALLVFTPLEELLELCRSNENTVYNTKVWQSIVDPLVNAHKQLKQIVKQNKPIIELNETDLCALCCDGGGIRGLVLIELLSAIQIYTRYEIHKLFNFVAGKITHPL